MPAAILEEDIIDNVLAGARISREEARQLYRLPLNELGELANHRRNLASRGKHGGRGAEIVTYIVDRNINYTNVCDVYCKFCAFYRTETDADHYVLTREQLDRAAVKYGRALAHCGVMAGAIEQACAGRDYDVEVSVDETDAVTSPRDHLFCGLELERRGVPATSLAPRFIGEFEKGMNCVRIFGRTAAQPGILPGPRC